MDPLSQGVFGALWASSASSREESRRSTAIGALAGMAADLDVLIRSDDDPLLALQFHRHFTHSLFFVPVGALLCSFVFKLFLKKTKFSKIYLWSLLGFASHGILDAFTSYGTQLFWPFSNTRVAWDSISIIDPLFTLPLLFAVLVWAFKSKIKLRNFAFVWATLYLALGFVQRDRALAEVEALAESRGHRPLRVSAKPSIGNLWLFRGLYETEHDLYADAIRVPFFGTNKIYTGGTLRKFDVSSLSIPAESTLIKDIERFAWFSDQSLAASPHQETAKPGQVIAGDFRYSMLPTSISPLWGIVVDPSRPNKHVAFESFRSVSKSDRSELWHMLMGD